MKTKMQNEAETTMEISKSLQKAFKVDYVVSGGMMHLLVEAGMTPEEARNFFIEANKREDTLEYVSREMSRILKNRKG